MTRYITLAEYYWLAEQVTGIEASILMTAGRIELADSALHAPAAGFGDQEDVKFAHRDVKNHDGQRGVTRKLGGRVGDKKCNPMGATGEDARLIEKNFKVFFGKTDYFLPFIRTTKWRNHFKVTRKGKQ